jgi:hypothetical protein
VTTLQKRIAEICSPHLLQLSQYTLPAQSTECRYFLWLVRIVAELR